MRQEHEYLDSTSKLALASLLVLEFVTVLLETLSAEIYKHESPYPVSKFNVFN